MDYWSITHQTTNTELSFLKHETLQTPLIQWKHKNMCHMSTKKVCNTLKKTCTRSVNKSYIDDWALYNLLKAYMKHTHTQTLQNQNPLHPTNLVRSRLLRGPENELGYNNILGIIDLASGNLVLSPVQNRTAANTTHSLLWHSSSEGNTPAFPLRFCEWILVNDNVHPTILVGYK